MLKELYSKALCSNALFSKALCSNAMDGNAKEFSEGWHWR